MVAAHVFKPRGQPGKLMGVVVFDSETNDYRNADDPEQDRWDRQLRGFLETDPEWPDGDVLITL